MKKKNCWLQSSAAEPFSDGAFNPFLIIFLAAKIWFIKSKSTVPLWENVKNGKKKFFFKLIKKLLIHPPKANNVRLLKTRSITSAEVYTSLKSDFSKVKWLQRHTRTPPDHSPSNGGGNCGSILLFLLNGYIKKCISSLNRCYIYNLVLLAISKQDIVLLENNWTFITLLKCYILFKQLQKGEINERIREKENMMNLIFF